MMRWSILGVFSVACVTDTTLEIKHENPEIQIVEPVTLSPIMEGEVLEFLAEGGDDKREESLQAEWYRDNEVICPLAPLDIDKRTACSIPFEDKDAQVRVIVFDDEGGGGADFRDVRVIARLAPEVEIANHPTSASPTRRAYRCCPVRPFLAARARPRLRAASLGF